MSHEFCTNPECGCGRSDRTSTDELADLRFKNAKLQRMLQESNEEKEQWRSNAEAMSAAKTGESVIADELRRLFKERDEKIARLLDTQSKTVGPKAYAELAAERDDLRAKLAEAERDRDAVQRMHTSALRQGTEAQSERDAAIKRAEEAERERNHAVRRTSAKQTEMMKAVEERDRLAAELERAREALRQVSGGTCLNETCHCCTANGKIASDALASPADAEKQEPKSDDGDEQDFGEFGVDDSIDLSHIDRVPPRTDTRAVLSSLREEVSRTSAIGREAVLALVDAKLASLGGGAVEHPHTALLRECRAWLLFYWGDGPKPAPLSSDVPDRLLARLDTAFDTKRGKGE